MCIRNPLQHASHLGKIHVTTGVILGSISLVLLMVAGCFLFNLASGQDPPDLWVSLIGIAVSMLGSLYLLMLAQAALIYALFRRLAARPFWSAHPRHAMLVAMIPVAILTSILLPFWQHVLLSATGR